MRVNPETTERLKRLQRARHIVVLAAETLVAAGGGSDELREALDLHTDAARDFEEAVE